MKTLVIGGTGSLGYAVIPKLLDAAYPKDRIRIMARDEHKLEHMEKQFSSKMLDFFVGDVRDRKRLKSAMKDVEEVYHFAAIKTVPGAAYNPMESKKTNIDGTANVVWCCHNSGVKRAIFTSSDKAVCPKSDNTYGIHKAVAEDLFIKGNMGKTETTCKFAAVRYGNVLGSRGSVVEVWDGIEELPICHPDMSRFWWTIEDAASFVVASMHRMEGGEVFIPRLKSSTLYQLAQVYEKPWRVIGTRPGEKMHEMLISKDEAYLTRWVSEYDAFIKYPDFPHFKVNKKGFKVDENYEYTSWDADRFRPHELRRLLLSTGLCREMEVLEWLRSYSTQEVAITGT